MSDASEANGNGNGADETTSNGNGNGNGPLYGILAEYDTPGELLEAARKVKDAGYTEFDCYSPFPVHGIDPAMGIKRTILPLVIWSAAPRWCSRTGCPWSGPRGCWATRFPSG